MLKVVDYNVCQHEGLVDAAKPVDLGLGGLEAQLELPLDGLEILDVAGKV
jgi:hypothetical protein